MFSLREKFLILFLALLVGAGIFLYVKARPSADVVNVPFVTEPMVAAGYDHSVALKADGTVLAWGGNPGDNWAAMRGIILYRMLLNQNRLLVLLMSQNLYAPRSYVGPYLRRHC